MMAKVADGKTYATSFTSKDLVVRGYYKGEGGDPLVDGWFPTGDVGTIDRWVPANHHRKDVIKSGGEWISSIEKNTAVAHLRCRLGCIGVVHPVDAPHCRVKKPYGRDVTA
jgi:fatty-acyl-CoA synthase